MTERTQPQAGDDQQRSRQRSLHGTRPPTHVPGYEPQRLLGTGAYGEVWVALDRNTGRRVAIKFYTHRGGLDWSLLSREVEKLVFLSADRYVVQLLDVGWDADPPYYVMEYLERGSLEDRIARDGPLPSAEAVAMFREIAVGLLHAHGKGVLHCDLKPANVLVDQDSRPRLADFGQSRLSHEQTPALGTLFYMAPEQADLKAVPDARWDVYALGAVLYCMLTGSPPHRDETIVAGLDETVDLEQRLARYRQAIRKAAPPRAHRQVAGVDRSLAEVVDRALAVDPRDRFANVQAVLDALAARDLRRARRPLVVLGALGPALVLLLAAIFAWQSFTTVVRQSDRELTQAALEGNEFAARFVARAAGDELGRRFRAVEQLARDRSLRELLRNIQDNTALAPIRARLSDPALLADSPEAVGLRQQLTADPRIVQLQQVLSDTRADRGEPPSASWFADDERGLQLARSPRSRTIGQNFAWRTYFSGYPVDQPHDWRPAAGDHMVGTHLSAAFLSQATGNWIVTISTPVYDVESGQRFLGVVALTVEVGGFVELRGDRDRFGVLVDLREGTNRGLVLQHPLYDKLREKGTRAPLPTRLTSVRLADEALPKTDSRRRDYVDPFAADSDGADFRRHWLAAMAPVEVWDRETGRPRPTGWQVIVQQSYDGAIGKPLSELRHRLVVSGLTALLAATVVLSLLWGVVLRGLGGRRAWLAPPAPGPPTSTPIEIASTLPDVAARGKEHRS